MTFFLAPDFRNNPRLLDSLLRESVEGGAAVTFFDYSGGLKTDRFRPNIRTVGGIDYVSSQYLDESDGI